MSAGTKVFIFLFMVATAGLFSACSSSGGGYRGYASYGIDYGRYYGRRPWGYYPGYNPGGPSLPEIDQGPVAEQLPEMGMPDLGGGMDMGMDLDMGLDMGGFD